MQALVAAMRKLAARGLRHAQASPAYDGAKLYRLAENLMHPLLGTVREAA